MAAILLNGDIDIAADASHSGTKNGGCRCTRAHALRWQITPRWGWMQLHLYQGLHPSLMDYAPLGLDAAAPVRGFTPFAGR